MSEHKKSYEQMKPQGYVLLTLFMLFIFAIVMSPKMLSDFYTSNSKHTQAYKTIDNEVITKPTLATKTAYNDNNDYNGTLTIENENLQAIYREHNISLHNNLVISSNLLISIYEKLKSNNKLIMKLYNLDKMQININDINTYGFYMLTETTRTDGTFLLEFYEVSQLGVTQEYAGTLSKSNK